MREIGRFIDDMAEEDLPVQLVVWMRPDRSWGARIADAESPHDILDRRGDRILHVVRDTMDEALEALDLLCGVRGN